MQDWIRLILERFIANEISIIDAKAELLSRFTDCWTPQGAQRAADYVQSIIIRTKYDSLDIEEAIGELANAMAQKAG